MPKSRFDLFSVRINPTYMIIFSYSSVGSVEVRAGLPEIDEKVQEKLGGDDRGCR